MYRRERILHRNAYYPRNKGYSDYYMITLFPSILEVPDDMTYPYFKNLFVLYAKTFEDFIAYLVYHSGGPWHQDHQEDHRLLSNVHLFIHKMLSREEFEDAITEILNGDFLLHCQICPPMCHGRSIEDENACLIEYPTYDFLLHNHPIPAYRANAISVQRSMIISMELLKRLLQIFYPHAAQGVLDRPRNFGGVFYKTFYNHGRLEYDNEFIPYDTDIQGEIVDEMTNDLGFDFINNYGRGQIPLAHIVCTYVTGVSITQPDPNNRAAVFHRTTEQPFAEYLHERDVIAAQSRDMERDNYILMMERHLRHPHEDEGGSDNDTSSSDDDDDDDDDDDYSTDSDGVYMDHHGMQAPDYDDDDDDDNERMEDNEEEEMEQEDEEDDMTPEERAAYYELMQTAQAFIDHPEYTHNHDVINALIQGWSEAMPEYRPEGSGYSYFY